MTTSQTNQTARTGEVFDIGYQNYEGPREGRRRVRMRSGLLCTALFLPTKRASDHRPLQGSSGRRRWPTIVRVQPAAADTGRVRPGTDGRRNERSADPQGPQALRRQLRLRHERAVAVAPPFLRRLHHNRIHAVASMLLMIFTLATAAAAPPPLPALRQRQRQRRSRRRRRRSLRCCRFVRSARL